MINTTVRPEVLKTIAAEPIIGAVATYCDTLATLYKNDTLTHERFKSLVPSYIYYGLNMTESTVIRLTYDELRPYLMEAVYRHFDTIHQYKYATEEV